MSMMIFLMLFELDTSYLADKLQVIKTEAKEMRLLIFLSSRETR